MNAAAAAADTVFPLLARAVVVAPSELIIDVRHSVASSIVVARPVGCETGNLIGKAGRTVKAFELLARLVGDRHQWPVTYVVDVPPGDNPPPASRPKLKLVYRWDATIANKLLLDTLKAFMFGEPTVTVKSFEYSTGFEVLIPDGEPVPDAEMQYSYMATGGPKGDGAEAIHRVYGDAAVSVALNIVFAAVGRIAGNKITIAYIRRSGSYEVPQPNTAAGRYSKEIT